MHKKNPIATYGIILLILFALLLLAPSLVKAQRTAGVQVGDWADYVVLYQGNSTEMMSEDLMNVTGIMLTVIGVSGTNVTFESLTHFENGSDSVETGWIDVDTGHDGGDFSGEGILIAANLNESDRVYTDDGTIFMDGTINETVTRSYLGGEVEVNHYIYNMSISFESWFNQTIMMSWYWYKDTGIPAQMDFYFKQEIDFLSEKNMTWFEINITVADIVPELPTSSFLPLFIFITIAAVALVKIQSKYKKFTSPLA